LLLDKVVYIMDSLDQPLWNPTLGVKHGNDTN